MEKINQSLEELLLDYLSTNKSSIEDLHKKLNNLEEVSLMNNQLLGFLGKIITRGEESLGNLGMPLSRELQEELIKHSAELETWGKS